MKNDDFWKSQFVKHDPTPGTGKPTTIPAPAETSVESRQRWAKGRCHYGVAITNNGKNVPSSPRNSSHTEFRQVCVVDLVEFSDEDENSVGAMAAESETGTREEMEPIRIMPV